MNIYIYMYRYTYIYTYTVGAIILERFTLDVNFNNLKFKKLKFFFIETKFNVF
jgi:hypothetical protein